MRPYHIALAALTLLPSLSNAAPAVNLSAMSCSGTQSLSFAGYLSLGCTGNFSLSGGSIISDSWIQISSGGSLLLDHLAIAAPQISLFSGGFLSIGKNASLDISAFNAGIITIGVRPITPFIGVRPITPFPASIAGTILIGNRFNNEDAQISLGGGGDLSLAARSTWLPSTGAGLISPWQGGALSLTEGGNISISNASGNANSYITISPVPESGAAVMLLAGLCVVGGFCYARKRPRARRDDGLRRFNLPGW